MCYTYKYGTDSENFKIAVYSFIKRYRNYRENRSKVSQGGKKSQILALPFVNLPPTEYDTVLTVLKFASDETKHASLHSTNRFV